MKKPESEPRKKGCMNAKDAQDLCGLLAGAVSSNTIGAEFKTFSTELEALAQEDAKRHRQETLDKALETLLLTAQKTMGSMRSLSMRSWTLSAHAKTCSSLLGLQRRSAVVIVMLYCHAAMSFFGLDSQCCKSY